MKLYFLSLALPALAVACGGNPGDKTSARSTTQADQGTAQLGDRCGGFVANPQQCDPTANLYCKGSGIPDMPGTCTSCDGFGLLPRIAQVCSDGNTYSAHWVTTGGTCQIQVCPDGAACVDNGECLSNQHWDATQCQCVANFAACNIVIQCVAGSHFDGKSCACVPNTTGNSGDPCTPDGTNLQDGCSAGLYCATDGSGSSSCAPLGNVGDSCSLAVGGQLANQQCQNGLQCVVADPNGDPNAGVCSN